MVDVADPAIVQKTVVVPGAWLLAAVSTRPQHWSAGCAQLRLTAIDGQASVRAMLAGGAVA